MEKTHYRKAFNSPYLSSADIVEPTVLTVSNVKLVIDQSKKTKDLFNTAYFAEKEIRQGEPLKPMILNSTNSRTMANLAGSKFIDDWVNIPVTIYVDSNVRFGRDTVEGLRISTERPRVTKPTLTPENTRAWANAKKAFHRDGNLKAVKEKMIISKEHELLLVGECQQ
jgi:hypothetical protein